MFNGNNKYIQYSYISKRAEDGFDTLQLRQFQNLLKSAVSTLSAERKFSERQKKIARQARQEKNVGQLLGNQSRTLSSISKKQVTKEQMHAVIYFVAYMKISHESEHEQLARMPRTVYMFQHINVSFLRQVVIDSKISARAGFPPFPFEKAVLQAKSGQPFQPVSFHDSVCAMFASFLQQQLVDAGHKTARLFHYSAYLVHSFVLLHSFFNLWNELFYDRSERVTTAIDPNHRVFMQETKQFSFTQVLNIVVYYSADRPVSKVRDISDFSRPDMFRQMLVNDNRSIVKVEVLFGAPLSQEVYRQNVRDKSTNKSTIIKHKPRTWYMNLLDQPQQDAKQMLDGSYSALSAEATEGLDSATQADSQDQVYLITAFVLLLLNAPGVSPYHQDNDLYQQDNTGIIAARGKKGILKGNYSYGPGYFMDQFYKFFKRHGNLQAAQQRFFQNACLIQPYHKLLLNNKNVPCLLECACLILAEQYVILWKDRQKKDIKAVHPLEALLDSIFNMELITDLVMRRVSNDNNRCTVNQADRSLWQQFCQSIGFFTGPQGKDAPLITSDQMSCVVSFVHSLAKLFYLPTQNSQQTGNHLLLPHVIMMDELLLSINYNMLAGQLLEQIQKDQDEVGGVINLLEWNMFDYDMADSQFNMFYLLRAIEKIYRQNCGEQSIELQRSFCIPSLVTQELCMNTANSNNLVLVLMDNHVQVCDMISINKVIVFYVRYLLQIKQSNQALYDRRRTAALLQSSNGSEGEITSQFFYDEAEEEHPVIYMDAEQEEEADAASAFQNDPSQITVKGTVKKINSLGMKKFKFLLDNIYQVYGPKSTFSEDHKNNKVVIETLCMFNSYFKQNIQRFNAVSPQHLEDAKQYRLYQFNKFGMAGVDIETCTIPLNTEMDSEDKFTCFQQMYGFDPETVGNQVPWMVSIVGTLYSCIDKQMHYVDKVFTSSPYSIDTCIDQLIIYLYQEGFMYNEDEVDAQKCPASGQDMFQSCTNLLYTFNGANFDHKFIFPRLQKFCNVKWIQGSHKSVKQFSTYNCVFGDLAQFFVGQSLAAVSKAWLKDTQWECYIKFKLDGEIQPALTDVQDMLLIYNQLHLFRGRVESSDIDMFEITSTQDVRLISFFDHLNEQPEFNFSSIDKTDIKEFYDLYQRAFNFVQYCRQDSCATYYSTKRFFQTLYDINIKNEATYANSDMYAVIHSYDIPDKESGEQIIGKNFRTSAKYVRAIREMLRRGVTLYDYFSFVDGVTEETSDYECFKFTYYSFMQSSVPLGSAALCLDMAKDTFGVSLPSIPALHEIEKQSYAGGLTQQIMRDYVIGMSIDINSAYPTAYLQDLPVYIEALVLSGYIFQKYNSNKSTKKRHNNENAKEVMSKLNHVGDVYTNGDEDFKDDPEFTAYMQRVTDPTNYERIVNLCTNVNLGDVQLMQDKDDFCVLNVSENLQSKFSEFVPYHLYRVTRFKFDSNRTFVPCIPVKILDTLYVTPMSYDREEDTFNKIHEYVNNMEMTTTYEERRSNRETIIDEILKLDADSRFQQEEFKQKYRKENDQYIELWVWGVQLNQARLQGIDTLCVDKVIRYVGMPFLEDYCQVLYQLKSTTKSSCKKILYKLLLNALYGKFAQKSYPASCYVQSNELISSYLDVYYKNGQDNGIAVQQASKLGGFAQYAIKYQDLEQKFNKTGVLVRIASFITATARANLLQGAHQVSYYLTMYKDLLKLEPHHVIAYMDTDSLYVALDILLIKDVEGFGPVLFKELKKRQVQELLTNDTTQEYKDYLVSDSVMQKALKYVCEVIRYIQENCVQVDQKYMSNRNYSQFWEDYQPPSVKMIHQTRLGAFKIEKLIMNFIALGQKLYTAYYIEDDVFEWSPELFQDVNKIKVDVKLKGVSRTVVSKLGRNIIKDMVRDSHVQESLEDQNIGSKRREVILASTVTPVLQTWSKEYTDGSMISYQRKIISESGYKVACLDTIMPLGEQHKHKFWPNIKSLYNYYLCTRRDDMMFTSEVMKMTCILNDTSVDKAIQKLQDTERLLCPEELDKDYKLSNIEQCDKLAQKMHLNIQVNRKFKEINEKIRCVHYMQLKRDQILKDRSEHQFDNDVKQVEDFIEDNEIDNMHNNIIRRNLLPMTMQTKDQFNGQSVGINQTSTERLYYDTLFKIDLIGMKSKSNVTPIVKEQFKQTLDLMERLFFYVMMMSNICNQNIEQCEYMDWAYELSQSNSFKFNSMVNDSSASEGSVTSKKSKSSVRFQNCKAQYNKRGHQKRHVTGLVAARAYNKMISKIVPFVKQLASLSLYGSYFEQITPYFMFQYVVFVMNLMRQSFTSMDVESCLEQCYYQGRDTILKQYTMAAYSHSMKPGYHHHDSESMRLEEFNTMLEVIGGKVSPATLDDIKHSHVKVSLRSVLNFVSCNVMSKDDKMINTFVQSFDFIANSISTRSTEGMTDANVQSFMDSQKTMVEANKSQTYYNIDNDEASSKHSFEVPGVDLVYDSNSEDEKKKLPQFSLKKAANYNKDGSNYTQLMNSYKMSAYSLPAHYQLINQITIHFMRVLNKFDRCVFTRDMVNHVSGILAHSRPKNEYKDFAPAMVMIAYVYALGLHKSTRDTWSKLIFESPYISKHFVPIVNIDKDVTVVNAPTLFNGNCFVQCVFNILRLPSLETFITKNVCHSKKLEYYKVNHTQQTCLIHLNACWHYMTSDYHPYEGGTTFPAMRMIESFDATSIPSDFNKNKLKCSEVEQKSEYILYLWQKVFKRFMNHAMVKNNKPCKLQKIGDSIKKTIDQSQVVQLQDNDNIVEEPISKIEKSKVKISFDFTVVDQLQKNRDYVDIYVHDEKNKKRMYRDILMKQNKALQELDTLIVTGTQVDISDQQMESDAGEMIVT